jgi:RimJ/RimL family protein N-acetyltransferase
VELREGDIALRAWSQEDVPALVLELNEPEVRRWLPAIPVPYTEADALAFVRGEVYPDMSHAYAVTERGSLVGSIAMGLNEHGYRGRIGYWVSSRARRRGICTRALRLLARAAFDELDLQRLELITDPDNIGSQRCAERVGFRREGVLRAHLRHPDGRIRDSVLFGLLPGELLD